jgi:hypothetical protein
LPSPKGYQAVRKGKWKGLWSKVSQDSLCPVLLFDLDSDPYETTDLANKFPDVVSEIKSLMMTSRTKNPHYPLLPAEF